MKEKTAKTINIVLGILFLVAIVMIFLGYLIPPTFFINLGLIGFILLFLVFLIYFVFAIRNMFIDIKEKIENEDNRDDA